VFAICVGSPAAAWSFAGNVAGSEAIVAMPPVGRVWPGPSPLPSPGGAAELLLKNFHGSKVDNYFSRDGNFVSDVADAR
jgi:hypothetical protein